MASLTMIGILEKGYQDPNPRLEKKYFLILREDEKYKGRDGAEAGKSHFYKIGVYGKDGQSSQTIQAARALQPGQWVCLKEVKIEGREYQGSYYMDMTCYGRPMRLVAADGTVEYTQPRQQQAPNPVPAPHPQPSNCLVDDEIPF